jgi:hypothetical protein
MSMFEGLSDGVLIRLWFWGGLLGIVVITLVVGSIVERMDR